MREIKAVLILSLLGWMFMITVAVHDNRVYIEKTRDWLKTLQLVVRCVQVTDPCTRCGCTIYNQLMFDGSPDIYQTMCAKCGNPSPKDEAITKKWFDEHFNKLK